MSDEQKALKDRGDELAVYAHLLGRSAPTTVSTLVFHCGLPKARVGAALERLLAEKRVWKKDVAGTVYWSWFGPRHRGATPNVDALYTPKEER